MEKILSVKIKSCLDCPNLKKCSTHNGIIFECPLINKIISIHYLEGASVETKILENWFNNLCTLLETND